MCELTLTLPGEWSKVTLQPPAAFPHLRRAGLPAQSERVGCYTDERSQMLSFKNPRSEKT